MTKVLYVGSFDPFTYGHMNIVEQASKLFDEVIIAVMQNASKGAGFFTLDERLEIIKHIYENSTLDNFRVVTGSGAAVDLAMLYECKALVRGLRSLTEYAMEVLMRQTNKDISNNEINTVYLLADSEYQHLSSSMVKEVFDLGKDISKYIEPYVQEQMVKKKGR